MFNEADVESFSRARHWRSASTGRPRSSTPERGEPLFQSCIDKYVPLYRNRAFIEQFSRSLSGRFQRKPLTTASLCWWICFSIHRSSRPVPHPEHRRGVRCGLTKYMLSRYLRERDDANIKSVRI